MRKSREAAQRKTKMEHRECKELGEVEEWQDEVCAVAVSVPHLYTMMEEQALRLRLVAFIPLQDSCSVNPKQTRQEQMVRLNFSRKQSRK